MSKIFYMEWDGSFEEKSTWTMLLTMLVVYGWYFMQVTRSLSNAGGVVGNVDYRDIMLATVMLLVIILVVAHTAIGVLAPKEADLRDERDRQINRVGEYIGGYVAAGAALTGMGMAMYEQPHFWIANAILLGLVLSEVVSCTAKLILYRRGLQP